MSKRAKGNRLDLHDRRLIPEDVVRDYADIVERSAQALVRAAPPSVDIDDLIQVGTLGLLDAVARYTPEVGASFRTFASIRVRGAILDEIRKSSWAPRSAIRFHREVNREIQDAKQIETGARVCPKEIAERLGQTVEEYSERLQHVWRRRLESYDELLSNPETRSLLPASEEPEPLEAIQREERVSLLADAIRALSERDQQVLALRYKESLSLREIGRLLGVSESRASQLHSRAVERLEQAVRGLVS